MDDANDFPNDCEREQLHLSGAIQPHGALLVADADGRVTHVSSNIGDWLGATPAAWLGQPLAPPLRKFERDLREHPTWRAEGVARTALRLVDVVATTNPAGQFVLELLPHAAGTVAVRSPDAARDVAWDGEADLARARVALVESIADRLGMQRVMHYEFVDDGDGVVLAEALRGDAYGSYLGLRFPATDIPQIARALYADNPWRLIPDAPAPSVPLLSAHALPPPDLSFADLRSCSPVHAVYLGNMHVRTSLSFPLRAGDQLAALIACHHSQPTLPPRPRLHEASREVEDFAQRRFEFQARERLRDIGALESLWATLLQGVHDGATMRAAWPQVGAALMREFDADGAVWLDGDRVARAGRADALPDDALHVLDAWFSAGRHGDIWMTDALGREGPPGAADGACGVLAIQQRAGADARRWRLYLTRPEHVHEVTWGGRPDKPVEVVGGPAQISPRRSFERWVETRRGHGRRWTPVQRLRALALRRALFERWR